jgi:hypothetical protein
MRQSAATLANSVCWKKHANDHSFQRSLLPHIAALENRASSVGLHLVPDIFEKREIGRLYLDVQKWNAAENILRATLESSKKLLGPEHLLTLSCLGSLAEAVGQQGREAEAEELHWLEFELTKKVLSLEHPDTLTSMENMDAAVWRQGRTAEAEELHR